MSAWPAIGPQVPRRHSALLRAFGRSVLAVLGWSVEGEIPDRGRFVIAVGPHTSNWDFVVGTAAMFALDLRLAFLGKHTIFRGPWGAVLRAMGGIPVDRTQAHGVVADSIRAFQRSEQLVLAIAPQGTRRPVPRFKSGFLHIARGAGVPVLFAALDYETRRVRLGPAFEPGPDIEAERERAEAFFRPIRGRRPR